MNANESSRGTLNAPKAGRVLPTLNADGSRRWIRPRLSPGRFLNARRVVGWLLIVFFVAAPWVKLGGRPLFLLDIPERRFIVFAAEFRPTDTFFLMLLLLAIFLGIFWLTALVGRVWCGWGCPQTVYMELVFRPIERLFEGGPNQQLAQDKRGWFTPRRLAKYAVFALISVGLANVFLAYFAGAETVLGWMTRPPWEHPVGFSVVALTSLLMFFDFAYFRDQMCTVACPYARLQSVLLDAHSLIVGYDAGRGEPRGKKKDREEGRALGDCIDCGACVQTCPTGIDIREGLQLECVGCAQCIDACDAIMDKLERPRGLIRYTSKAELAGKPRRVLRPRVVVYPLALAVVGALFLVQVGARTQADVWVLRQEGAPFTLLDDGSVSTPVRLKIENRAREPRTYRIELRDPGATRIISPRAEYRLEPGGRVVAPLFVISPRDGFTRGERAAQAVVSDDAGWSTTLAVTVLGPEGTP